MGKGSKRRNEDTDKIRDNWDVIWGKKDKKEETPSKEEDSKKTK